MNKKKYYLIGTLLFIAIIIGYHFFAASQAEQQLDEAFQEQAKKAGNISIQYSEIEVSPFAADITIRDLTVIWDNHIKRSQHLQLDIGYFDFLSIYFGGLEYGLEHLSQAKITAYHPSYINRSGLEEIKSDTLHISYRGNALEGVRSVAYDIPLEIEQAFDIRGTGFRVIFPQETSKIKAHSFQYAGNLDRGTSTFFKNGNHQFRLDSINWTPPSTIQEKYGFFIKGFGYSTDAIPFESAQLHIKQTTNPDILEINSSLSSDLALLTGSGSLKLNQPISTSEFQDMQIDITDLSQELQNVLGNLERLFSISLPQKDGEISIRLMGTLANPTIADSE